MKDEILINILFDFLANKKLSASYLASKHGVSKRTIFRYIDTLSLTIPITTDRGRNGGYYISDSYKIPASFLSEKEYEKVISTLVAINKELDSKELDNGINKLKSAYKGEKSSLTVQGGNLIIDAGPWGGAKGYKAKLSVMEKSIEQNLLLSISYHDREGEVTKRIIEPHAIVFKQGLWYIYAYCQMREDFRLFKVGRIESANILDKTFTRREMPEKSFDDWYNNIPTEEISLQINKTIVSDIEEWLGVENVKREDGNYIAKVSLPVDEGLINKLLSFGSGIKVLAPEKLKDKMLETVKQIINNY